MLVFRIRVKMEDHASSTNQQDLFDVIVQQDTRDVPVMLVSFDMELW